MRVSAVFGVVALLLTSCRAEEPAVPRTAAAPPPKWMRDEKPAELSPAAKALVAAEDPDLKKQLSPAEVKAALAAAQYQTRAAAPPPPAALPSGESADYKKLEGAQKKRDEAYQRLLASTVYGAAGDEQYHSAGCAWLFAIVRDENGYFMRRQYVGFPITLGAAKQRNMRRHDVCNAPSGDYRY